MAEGVPGIAFDDCIVDAAAQTLTGNLVGAATTGKVVDAALAELA